MSVREDIELYGLPDEERYTKILTGEFAATRHPSQPEAYMLDSLPFYAPRLVDDHLSILGFNYIAPALLAGRGVDFSSGFVLRRHSRSLDARARFDI